MKILVPVCLVLVLSCVALTAVLLRRHHDLEDRFARLEMNVESIQGSLDEAQGTAHGMARRREVIEKIARLLEQGYAAFDERRFDRTIHLCDEILVIDPRYTIASELKEDATRARH